MATIIETPAFLLKKVEQEERKKRAALEVTLQEARKKTLAKILKPLLEEKTQTETRIKEDGKRLSQIIKDIEKLTGVAEEKPATGKRGRRRKEDLKVEAEKIVEMAKAKDGTNKSAIIAAGLKPGQDIVKWVKTHAGVTLTPKGETSSRTYHA